MHMVSTHTHTHTHTGVTCIHIDDRVGLDMATLKRGLKEFSKTH